MDYELIKERNYLKKTINEFKRVVSVTEEKAKVIPRMYKDYPDMVDSMLKEYGHKINLLNRTLNKPYFARIDFKDNKEDKEEVCYIGKTGVIDEDNKILTVDWRAPIASIYYDSNIGEVSYQAPLGTVTGNLLLKRQYDIENGILNSYQDVDTVANDEMLKPYLGASADKRLKNIVSTIQQEQNAIIRENIHKDIIVHGVAGSGKTTVALHRIAYLVYNNMEYIKPEQYLVIGPNKFFVNYISGVLPDLDVDNVKELTYDEILASLVKDKFTLLSDEDNLITSIVNPEKLVFDGLKVSMKYKEAIDKYLDNYFNNIIPNEDFNINGYHIFDKDFIANIYNHIEEDSSLDYSILSKKIERTNLFINKYIIEHCDSIKARLQKAYTDKLFNNIEEERKKFSLVERELKNNFKQSLKKYFSKAYPNIFNLYLDFLTNIDNYLTLDDIKISDYTISLIANLKKKKIHFEDLGALLYLYYRLYGNVDYDRYRHVVIDEAQDFGEFNFYILKKIMPNSNFTIFGDLAQSIYSYRGISSWERVIETSFNNKCDIKYLLKSYRTTTEIINEANKVTSYIGLNTAVPVIRHGNNVSYKKINNNTIDELINILEDYKKKSYSSTAIICKDEQEATNINRLLKENNYDLVNITSSDTTYSGGLCTITSYLAKGLEFDGVIITNAGEYIYNSNKKIDMKLLYVAMTRPLHELTILYSDKLNTVLYHID